MKKCCFAGHSKINDDTIGEMIRNKAEEIIKAEGVNEFWVGNYGDFDRLSSFEIKKLKRKYNDIRIVLVIPYLTKKIDSYRDEYYDIYDEIVLSDIKDGTPKKFQIMKNNEYMVDNSDFMICYIKYGWGGAIKTLEYAKRRNIKVYNLAE